MAQDFITIIHQEPEIQTIGALLERSDAGRLIEDMTATELLDFEGDTGIQNRERLRYKWGPKEFAKVQDNSPSDEELPIAPNTELVVPNNKLDRETLLSTNPNIVDSTNGLAFMADKIMELHRDVNYIRLEPLTRGLGTYKADFPHISVWIWCRALSSDEDSSNPDGLQGTLINVSRFVQSVNTTMTKTGGQFNLQLSPLICEVDTQEGWVIKKGSLEGYAVGGKQANYHAHSQFHRLEDSELKENQFFFHNIINSNDMVFVRYETLRSEAEDRLRDEQLFTLSPSDLPNKIFDMIGLVDQNIKADKFSEGPEVSINITGRDLMKTLIEDGTYFFPLEYAQGVFYNASKRNQQRIKNGLIERVLIDGRNELNSLGLKMRRSISYSIQFVINQLSNTGLVPDQVFVGYGSVLTEDGEIVDKRSKRFALSESQETTKEKNDAEGLREAIALNLIASRRHYEFPTPDDRGQVSPLVNDLIQIARDGNAGSTDAFSQVTSQVRSALLNEAYKEIQSEYDEVREAYAISEYVAFATQNAINYVKSEQKIVEFTPDITQENLKGVWQIIKLVIDSSVSERRVVDTSLAMEQGSLINTFNKLCQDPFVEFFGDTYGDQYYLIVRVPPFDKTKIQSILAGSVSTKRGNYDDTARPGPPKFKTVGSEDLKSKGSKYQRKEAPGGKRDNVFDGSLVIDVEEYDVLEKTLQYNDTDVHTWFKLQPQGFNNGDSDKLPLAYLPAINLPRYEEIWGSRPLDIVTGYIPFKAVGDRNKNQQQNYIERQTYYDLKWMIDTHCYLPFTRSGSIVLNGDRRIKRGTFIRLRGTKEIYYVDNVMQNYNVNNATIDRTTTVIVSRGMVEEFIFGREVEINGKTQLMSYFNIVDTTLKEEQFEVDSNGERKLNANVLEEFGVNDDVFDFFLKRKQWS